MANIPSCIAGAYSCLRVVLTFARQLSFFIFTIYIPCFMIVIVSWMSFWIDHKAVSHKIIFAKFAKKMEVQGADKVPESHTNRTSDG